MEKGSIQKRNPNELVLEDSYQLSLIPHEIQGGVIQQRVTDGYINATSICNSCGKLWGNYYRNTSTEEFLEELSTVMRIRITGEDGLIQLIQGGVPSLQGTWVHPDVAIHLAQWASPKFAVAVSRWVREWLTGNVPNKNNLPYHIQRYLINRSEIPPTHFSIFNEIMLNLIAPLEDRGYQLPDKMVPDISEGRMFAGWLRKAKGLEPNDFPTYTHTYPDGRRVPNVKLYPNELLADFRKHFYNVWIKERAKAYFSKRDLNAIPYLEKMLISLPRIRGGIDI